MGVLDIVVVWAGGGWCILCVMFCILGDGDGDEWDGIMTRALYKVLCRKEEGGRTMEGRYLD